VVISVVWQSIDALLRDPHLLVEQYQCRQVQGPSTPEQHEQHRLPRKLATLQREEQRLIDAYQASVIDLADLQVRCERIAEERTRMEARLVSLKQQQEETERQVSLTATLEEFCHNIRAALETPSFATKQRLLRLMVDQIVVTAEQITIKHVIPLSDVRLQRQHYSVQRGRPPGGGPSRRRTHNAKRGYSTRGSAPPLAGPFLWSEETAIGQLYGRREPALDVQQYPGTVGVLADRPHQQASIEVVKTPGDVQM